MTHRRLFLKDITDEHLTHLHRAAIIAPDGKTAKDWIEEIGNGNLALFEVPGGIIGLKIRRGHAWVELLAGKDMKPHAKELVDTVRTLAGDREIEGFVVNPAVLRVYKSLGFEPVGTFVRLPNGKST
jgi:hypothetical protein